MLLWILLFCQIIFAFSRSPFCHLVKWRGSSFASTEGLSCLNQHFICFCRENITKTKGFRFRNYHISSLFAFIIVIALSSPLNLLRIFYCGRIVFCSFSLICEKIIAQLVIVQRKSEHRNAQLTTELVFFIAFEVWPKKVIVFSTFSMQIEEVVHSFTSSQSLSSFFCSHRRLVIVNCSRHPPRFSAIIVRLVFFSYLSHLFAYYKKIKYEFYECFNALLPIKFITFLCSNIYLKKLSNCLFVAERWKKSCLTLFVFIDQ